MTTFQIIALYVALNLIFVTVLVMRIGKNRMAKKVSLGDGGDEGLNARIRTHGNFIENAPLALIGLFALAMMGAHPIALHVFGAAFLMGRLLHAQGMAQAGSNGMGRGLGAMLTMLVFLGQAGYLIYLAITFAAI